MDEQATTLNGWTKEELDMESKHVKEALETADKAIDLNKKLSVLMMDENFQAIIEDLYFSREVERIMGLLVTPTTLARDQIQNLNDKLGAIRSLKAFFAMIQKEAVQAEMTKEEGEAFLSAAIKATPVSSETIDIEATEV